MINEAVVEVVDVYEVKLLKMNGLKADELYDALDDVFADPEFKPYKWIGIFRSFKTKHVSNPESKVSASTIMASTAKINQILELLASSVQKCAFELLRPALVYLAEEEEEDDDEESPQKLEGQDDGIVAKKDDGPKKSFSDVWFGHDGFGGLSQITARVQSVTAKFKDDVMTADTTTFIQENGVSIEGYRLNLQMARAINAHLNTQAELLLHVFPKDTPFNTLQQMSPEKVAQQIELNTSDSGSTIKTQSLVADYIEAHAALISHVVKSSSGKLGINDKTGATLGMLFDKECLMCHGI